MADIEITLPDKFVLRFPEGTPPDVIQRHSANEWMRRTSAASKADPNAGLGPNDVPVQGEAGMDPAMMQGGKGMEPYAQAANKAVNYVGTRAINAATNIAGLPRFIGDLGEMAGPGKGPEPQTALGRTLKPIHEAIDPVRWLQKLPSAMDMQQAIYSSPDAPPSPFNLPRQDSGMPIVDMAAEGAIGMMPGGVGLARQGADMAGRMFTGAAAGAGAEGLRNAAEGYGAGGGMQTAAALLGGLAGGGLGAGTVAAGRAARNIVKPPNPASAADEIMRRAMDRDAVTGADLQKRLQEYDPGTSIADVGGTNLQGSGKVVAAMPGRGRDMANEALTARDKASGDRIVGAIRRDVSARELIPTVEELSMQRAQAAEKAYEAAGIPTVPKGAKAQDAAAIYQQAPTIPAGEASALIDASPYIKSAVTEARKLPQYKDLPDNSVVLLDKARKNIQGMIDEADRTGNSARVRDLRYLRDMIDDGLGTAYKDAVKNYAVDSSVIKAADMGREVITKNLSPDAVKQVYSKMSPDEQAMFRSGLAEEFRRMAEDAKNPAVKIFGTKQKSERLKEILGADYEPFAKTMVTEMLQKQTFDRMGINRGSRTEPMRMEGQDHAAQMADFAGTAAQGSPMRAAVSMVFTTIKNKIGDRAKGYNDATNAELASRYFTGDPNAQAALLARLDQLRPPEGVMGTGRDAVLPGTAAPLSQIDPRRGN